MRLLTTSLCHAPSSARARTTVGSPLQCRQQRPVVSPCPDGPHPLCFGIAIRKPTCLTLTPRRSGTENRAPLELTTGLDTKTFVSLSTA